MHRVLDAGAQISLRLEPGWGTLFGNLLQTIPVDYFANTVKTESNLERRQYLRRHSQPAVAGQQGLAGTSARLGNTNPWEGRMSADLQFLEEWIPERMDPGTIFVLENQRKLGHAQNPYVAVMSCPRCGTMGLITRRQLHGGETMICGGDACSAEYRLDGENICFRRTQ